MNIFLTGATGFVGRYVLREAQARQHRVRAIRRDVSIEPEHQNGQPPIDWMHRNMHEIEAKDLAGIDAVIHLASAGVSPRQASWDEMVEVNVSGTLKILDAAARAGVGNIVLAGTFAEYGLGAERYEFIPPDAPLLPTFPYAASKAAAFSIAHAFAIEKRLRLVYLRIFSAFGEGQFEENFWPALRRKAQAGEDFLMTPGDQIRDYVPVETVAQRFVDAAELVGVAPGSPVVRNVGTGRSVSMKEFAGEWWKRWNAKGQLLVGALPYRPNEVMRFVPQVDDSP